MIGGGRVPRPGEATLSITECCFGRAAGVSPAGAGGAAPADGDGEVTIARVNATLSFPAKFMLVAAMNRARAATGATAAANAAARRAISAGNLRKISGRCWTDRYYIAVPRLEFRELAGDGAASRRRR
jgi:magnesium chelatase family protein